ncbi:hypothetical protein PQ478_19380 [Alkalihalophilus pseudofirmus]|uniref:hypothetical protein n=1 Tax=Alkalihalophilus pseudofirmus TaxID=79885 RepID=UPI00259B8728|nr:hypothetical protein [Alkalihalophilus pseudofirmus]WEG16641.1 hypothetical protein PQ478_19380 [Alkalihalophilus pseudofirmus]
MSTLKDATKFTEQQLKDLIQQIQQKGTDQADLTSSQLVEEIAAVLKPFVKQEEA